MFFQERQDRAVAAALEEAERQKEKAVAEAMETAERQKEKVVAEVMENAEKQRNRAVEEATKKAENKAILAFIRDKQEDGIPKERVIEKLMQYFQLNRDHAEKYYGKA